MSVALILLKSNYWELVFNSLLFLLFMRSFWLLCSPEQRAQKRLYKSGIGIEHKGLGNARFFFEEVRKIRVESFVLMIIYGFLLVIFIVY